MFEFNNQKVVSLHIGVIPLMRLCVKRLLKVASLYIGVILAFNKDCETSYSCFPVHRGYSIGVILKLISANSTLLVIFKPNFVCLFFKSISK